MPADGGEAEEFKKLRELFGVWACVFDELESVRANRIFKNIGHVAFSSAITR
jgi:hypothetical protein